MAEALQIVKKYYRDWKKFKGLENNKIIKKLVKGWNNLENKWFIKYLKDNLNNLSLGEISDLLKRLNMKFSPEILKDILKKCPELDVFMGKILIKGSKYPVEQLTEMDDIGLGFSYAVLKGNVEEKEEEEIEYDTSFMDSSDKMYLNELRRIPVISWEKTKEYFEKIEEYKDLLAKAIDEKTKAKYESQIIYYKNLIVQGNLRLTLKPATKKAAYGYSFLDLVQEGNLGLMRAVDKFDLSYGIRFSTYAVRWITALVDRCVQEDRTIQIPLNLQSEYVRFGKTKEKLQHEKGHRVSYEELGAVVGEEAKELEYVFSFIEGTSSLDVTITSDAEDTLINFIPGEGEFEEQLVDNLDINETLKILSAKEEAIIRYLFGIQVDKFDKVNTGKHSLEEAGKLFNVTRERIRQIKKRALRKMLAHYKPEQKAVKDKAGSHKSFFDYLPQEAVFCIPMLSEEEQSLLYKRFDNDLKGYNTMPKGDCNKIKSIITTLRELYKKANVEVLLPDEASSTISPFDSQEIKQLLDYVPLNCRAITGASLGLLDGKMYSTKAVSELLNVSPEEVELKRTNGILAIQEALKKGNNQTAPQQAENLTILSRRFVS